MKLGVINISDRASAGVYEDIPGKAAVALLEEWITTPFETAYAVIPDEQDNATKSMPSEVRPKPCPESPSFFSDFLDRYQLIPVHELITVGVVVGRKKRFCWQLKH